MRECLQRHHRTKADAKAVPILNAGDQQVEPPCDRRRAAIFVVTTSGLQREAHGAVIVQRLAQATLVRRGSSERQSYGGKSPHQQQNQQHSGGQAMHGDIWLLSQGEN